jgi:hypothetical protein
MSSVSQKADFETAALSKLTISVMYKMKELDGGEWERKF